MKERDSQHATFVIERTYPASKDRVYRAFAEPAAKARWFVGPPGRWRELERSHDFRIGGREQVKGAFEDGHVSHFDAVYHNIVPGERLIYSYGMYLDDKPISVSLSTVVLEESAAGGARLRYTEQIVFLDGYVDDGQRKFGTEGLFDQLGASLAEKELATAGREIVSRRRVGASPEAVFAAFADPARLARWWGPKGFRNTFEEFDLEAGGHWRFVMHGPDGKDYANHAIFEEVVPGERIFFEHQPPHHFLMRILLAKEGAGTMVSWRMIFDTPEAAEAAKPVVVPSNEENFDRLEAELERGTADA